MYRATSRLNQVRYPAAALLVTLILGCGTAPSTSTDGGPEESGGSQSELRIAMMPKLMGISFFDATGRGAQRAADELGLEVHYDGPVRDDPEQQVEMIHTWIAQGFDVIAVAPVDPDAVAPSLAEAIDAGVKVLTWDTDANAEKSRRSLFVNHTPNQGIADSLIDTMVAGAGENGKLKGKFIIISGSTTAANQNTWMSLMRPRLAEEHPDCELLETLYPGEDEREARVQAANALSAHPDLQGIWAITSVALPAAAKAARDANRADEVFGTGMSMPSLMREYVKDGTVEKFILFNVEDLGYLTVQMASRLAAGPVEPGTYDIGHIQGVRVEGDQVILGDPMIFDANNIDDFDF